MANTAQAKKRARQSETRRLHNASRRSKLRTYIKRVIRAIQSQNSEESQNQYQQLVPILDRMATKGLIHKNKAARHKSRLVTRLKKLASSEAQAS